MFNINDYMGNTMYNTMINTHNNPISNTNNNNISNLNINSNLTISKQQSPHLQSLLYSNSFSQFQSIYNNFSS
jgi:hypothetical protein